MKANKTPGLEENLAALEKIVEEMESGKPSLEESLALFEKGITLSKLCQQTLSDVEQRIKVLTNENGSVKLDDLDQKEG